MPIEYREWYQVDLQSLRIGGATVPNIAALSTPRAIVDSGTTDIVMSSSNRLAFLTAMANSDLVLFDASVDPSHILGFWFDRMILTIESKLVTFSNTTKIEAVISGIPIQIYTSNLIVVHQVDSEHIRMNIVGISDAGDGPTGTILGASFFMGQVLYFDRGDPAASPGQPNYGRIGFAQGVNCYGRWRVLFPQWDPIQLLMSCVQPNCRSTP